MISIPLTADKAFKHARSMFALSICVTKRTLQTRHYRRTFTVIIHNDSIKITPGIRPPDKTSINIDKDKFLDVYNYLHKNKKPNPPVRGVDGITHYGSYLFALIDAVKSDFMRSRIAASKGK